jgi:hypothetical protein
MRARRAGLMLMSALLGASVMVHAQPASPPAAATQAPQPTAHRGREFDARR